MIELNQEEKHDYLVAEPSKLTMMDVAPNQIASIAAS